MKQKKLLNIKETCEYLGVSYPTVKALFHNYPELVVFKHGRNVLTSKEVLDKYISSGSEAKKDI